MNEPAVTGETVPDVPAREVSITLRHPDGDQLVDMPLDEALSDGSALVADGWHLSYVHYGDLTDEGLAVALRAIQPLARIDHESDAEINGFEIRVAPTDDGGFGYVPVDPYDFGASVVASGDAAWLPGGPCEFTQDETIWRLGGFYWVTATGDMDQGTVIVGDLGSDDASLRAAVQASTYFSFTSDGRLHCQLDDGAGE